MSFADRVKVTSTTTGIGAYALGPASTGFRTFASAFTVGAQCEYCAENGLDWEVGIGTLTGASTLERTTILSSSNAGSAVNWTSGTKRIFCVWSASAAVSVSRRLTAPLDLYVRTDGNDSNLGNANTAGGAFLTIQKALDVAASYDTSNFSVLVHVAAGTYSEAGFLRMYGGNFNAGFDVQLIGDVATPANVVIDCFISAFAGFYSISGITIGTGWWINSGTAAELQIQNCRFDGSYAYGYQGVLQINGGVTFVNNVAQAIYAWRGTVLVNNAVAVSGTPAYSIAFAVAEAAGNIDFYAAPTGFATGKRYQVSTNGIINTYGGGANYLPGDAAGTTATGGQYA